MAAGLGLLQCLSLDAAEFWVSPSGSDTATGSPQQPLRTIRRAVATAHPGDTVYVWAGRYEENVAVPAEKSGTVEKWLTISAAPGDERQAVVGTEKPQVDAHGATSSAFALQGVKYVRLKGFKCVAPYRGRGSGIGAHQCEHIEIINCLVTGGGQGGVDANNCDFVTIDGVEACFNGGGTGWSSGISLFEPRGPENVIRNCICYGNYDQSSYRSDGNGIIVDNGYAKGGALLANNLCFMNGGKGICSTRSDHCTFINNTCVANCWQPNQQAMAHELSVRGRYNVVRNNLAVGGLPNAFGMMVLSSYSGPGGTVNIDLKSIVCDHNLFFNPKQPACVAITGDRLQKLTLEALRQAKPQWAAATLCLDPGFVDFENLDFRLRPDSPALRAGLTQPEAAFDLGGKPRAKSGACALGCYEGGFAPETGQRPQPGMEIGPGENPQAIEALLANRYELEWHGMLWGWGRLLPEELPLEVEVLGPSKADFLNLTGIFSLRELLQQITREHQVRLLIKQPVGTRELPTESRIISRRLAIRDGADAAEQALVRRALRACVWTREEDGRTSFAELLPALSAALGIKIESQPLIPPDRRFTMTTLNMRLSAFLTDLAERLDVRLTFSAWDPLGDPSKVQPVELDHPFGGNNGLVVLTVDQPDGRGHLNLFARVQPQSALCARLFADNSRFLSPAGIDDPGAGALYHRADTRLDRGSVVRLAVVGSGCALNIGGQWIVLNRLPANLSAGHFQLRKISDWVKVSKLRFVAL